MRYEKHRCMSRAHIMCAFAIIMRQFFEDDFWNRFHKNYGVKIQSAINTIVNV